ncbi:MAG TPA: VTT domain-containing protein [Candidatus Paceibacterota bacterium]
MPQFLNPEYIVTFGYVGIFVVIFLESGIFPPLPGDSLLFVIGLMAAGGVFNLYVLIALVFLGSFLGIASGYYVGSHLYRLRKFTFFDKILKPEYFERASIFFAKHGNFAIILSRFVPIVRTFVPITAGAARMNYFSFIWSSIIGSIIWALVFILGGFFLGKTFPEIIDYLMWIIIGVVFVSILPGIYELFRKR